MVRGVRNGLLGWSMGAGLWNWLLSPGFGMRSRAPVDSHATVPMRVVAASAHPVRSPGRAGAVRADRDP